MLLMLIIAQAAAADPFSERAWARFSRTPALRRASEVVEIATDGVDGRTLHYRLRLTRGRSGEAETVLWASSRTCPAVRAILGDMEALAMPRPDAPGVGPDADIVLDGVGYELRAPSTDGNGQLSLRSNIGSPLAAWVDRSMAALEPCWSAEPSGRG